MPLILDPINQKFKICTTYKEDNVHGIMKILTSDDSDKVIWKHSIRSEVHTDEISSLRYDILSIRSLLSGGTEFLNTILGAQSCSSTYPCYACLIKLVDLRTKQSIKNAPARI